MTNETQATTKVSVDGVLFNGRIFVDIKDIELALRAIWDLDGANAIKELFDQLNNNSRNLRKVEVSEFKCEY